MEKKSYISPVLTTTVVAAAGMIATSTLLDRSEENQLGQDDILVKDQGLGSSGNVWDDDWSR